MTWQEHYINRYYPKTKGWIDGTTEFHNLCTSEIPSGSLILEIGAGPSNPTSRFLGSIGKVVGLDIDPIVTTNKYLSAAYVLEEGDSYPFDDDSFHACVSDYVLEHLAAPTAHLAQVSRVLKPRGVYVFRTPNRFHYTALVGKATPHWFHELVANRLRNLGPSAHAPHPTFYRLNSRGAITKTAESVGLIVRELRMVEKEPSYGMSSRLLFKVFMTYERIVNRFEVFSGFRANIFGVLEKASQSHSSLTLRGGPS